MPLKQPVRRPKLYFRDSNDNEVDLLHGRSPNLVPIEITSGQTISSDGLAVLPADEVPAFLEAVT